MVLGLLRPVGPPEIQNESASLHSALQSSSETQTGIGDSVDL